MKNLFVLLFTSLFAGSVGAMPIFTSGAGSAVSSVDASADFENTAALSSGYVEDGLLFALSSNSCGFAGCAGHSGFYGGTTPFVGNYLYSGNVGQIEATGGNVFQGIELILGTGFNPNATLSVSWSTFLNGSLVGSGSSTPGIFPGIFGWYDANGFDKLIFNHPNCCLAFDSVKAQYVSAVPEPAFLPLLLMGVGAMMFLGRRPRKAA